MMIRLGSVTFEPEQIQQMLKTGKQLTKTSSEKTEIQKYFETRKRLFDISKGLDILSKKKNNHEPKNWLVRIQIQTLKQEVSVLNTEVENEEKPNTEVYKWLSHPVNMLDAKRNLTLKIHLLDIEHKKLAHNTFVPEKLNARVINLISDITYWIETIPEWIEKMSTVS